MPGEEVERLGGGGKTEMEVRGSPRCGGWRGAPCRNLTSRLQLRTQRRPQNSLGSLGRGRQAHSLPYPCVHQLYPGHCPSIAVPGTCLPTEREGSPRRGRRKPAGPPRHGLILAWLLASHVALGAVSGPEPQFPPLSSEERALTS